LRNKDSINLTSKCNIYKQTDYIALDFIKNNKEFMKGNYLKEDSKSGNTSKREIYSPFPL